MRQLLKSGPPASVKTNWRRFLASTLVLALALVALGCGSAIQVHHDGTLDADILTRVRQVRVADREAAAFTIEVDGKQYLISAAHLTDWKELGEIDIWHQGWRRVKVDVVGISQHPEDIIVFATNGLLTPTPHVAVGADGMKRGQDVRFLGFPLGLGMNLATQGGGIKLPLVKGGLLSGWGAMNNASVLIVDGHNNGGFSGGPVIFRPLESADQTWKIAGVVARYQWEGVDVIDHAGQVIGKAKGNSGILVASRIETALRLIELNPIGFPVTQQ